MVLGIDTIAEPGHLLLWLSLIYEVNANVIKRNLGKI